MHLDRLMTISAVRAAKITNLDRWTISKAMNAWTSSGGKLGLAFIVEPGSKRRKIRLCALDDWLSQLEQQSKYAY